MRRLRQLTIEPGRIYHVISRFVAQEYFVRGDEERRQYLSLLGTHMKEVDWDLLSYTVMSNHVHQGFRAGEMPLDEVLRKPHTLFAQWINRRLKRIGAVFVRGPNVIEVQPEGVARLIGYIHDNPVRAGLVPIARNSDWSSQRAYVGLAYKPSWLNVRLGLELSGFSSGEALERWCLDKPVTREALDEVSIPEQGVDDVLDDESDQSDPSSEITAPFNLLPWSMTT